MVMSWTVEANAKLFIGVLEQIKSKNVRLDYNALAEHMGPECNAKSVQNQFTKLRKQAAEEYGGSGTTTTPVSTPKKRAATEPKASPPKKVKAEDAEGES